jgi:hypothetical protein
VLTASDIGRDHDLMLEAGTGAPRDRMACVWRSIE